MDTKLDMQFNEIQDEPRLSGDCKSKFDKDIDQAHEKAYSSSSVEAQGKDNYKLSMLTIGTIIKKIKCRKKLK